MNLFYRKLGQGKPLFILHGLFGSSDNWQTLGKKFAEHFEVFLIDQRNHGQSFHSEEWNYTAMSNDLVGIMEENGLDKISIIGHSMGGKTALQFAINHSEKVEKLVVVDIASKYYPIHHRTILDSLLSLDLTHIASRKEAENILSQKITNSGELQFLLKNLYWKDAQNNQLAWRFNLPIINNNIEFIGEEQSAELKPIQVPTLFIRGDKSNYILDADFSSIKKSFLHASFETIPNSGHWVQAEQPLLFYNAVMAFL